MSLPVQATLTQGALNAIFHAEDPTAVPAKFAKPVLQLIDIKKIGPAPSAGPPIDRYRLVLSDGLNYQQAMLATQLNHLIESGALALHCIVRLKEFVQNLIATRKIIIVLDVETVAPPTGGMIGQPSNVDLSSKMGAGAAPVSAASPAGARTGPSSGPASSTTPTRPLQAPLTGAGAAGAGVPRQPFQPINNPGNRMQPMSNAIPRPAAGGNENFQPIATLNPYQNKWTIKVRVTHKSELRHYSNAKGEGKLFHVELLDSFGGEIRATMFNEACDKFYPVFQPDKVYSISRGQLKLANKKFSKGAEYEIHLNADAEITYLGEDASIEAIKFKFVPLSSLRERVGSNQNVDVIGIVTQVGPLGTVTSQKTKKELQRRVLTICDQDNKSVELTVWGDDAIKYSEATVQQGSVIAVKEARVSDFGGVSLSTTFGGQVALAPDRDEAHALRQWWDTEGHSAPIENQTVRGGGSGGGGAGGAGAGAGRDPRRTCQSIKDDKIGTDTSKADFSSVRGVITWFQNEPERPPWYLACPNVVDGKACNKKVSIDTTGQPTCLRCNATFPSANPRYILSMLITDATGQMWMTAFDETAAAVLGASATEMKNLLDEGRVPEYKKKFTDANFKQYIFKVRSKSETHNEEVRIKHTLDRITPIDFAAESSYLLSEIAKYG